AQIESELKLQIPLYMLVLRDLVGVEPLGGIYRALSGKRDARGLLRAEAKEDGVPGFSRNDYLDEEAFWGQVDRAGELARGFVERIRDGDVRLDRGRDDLARELDGAWISTIHGFCHRLLKTYPFAAGLDPRFRVLDDSQARVLRGEAFEEALGEFCAGDDPRRLRLLATYGAGGLWRMLTGVYETLRAAGRPLDLRLGEGPALAQRVEALREAARCLVDEEGHEEQRAQAAR